MRRKGIFTLLTAAFMVLAFSAVTFAAQTIIMKTTTPNIPKSPCYQAGSDTMEISADTIMQEGDIIQFTVSNGTTICKPINEFLVISGAAAGLIQPLDDIGDPSAPVTATDALDQITSSAALLGTEQWGFLVTAAANQQVIRLQLRVRNTAANALVVPATVANQLRAIAGAVTMRFDVALSASVDPTADKLFVKLFDGKGTGAGVSGFYVQAASPVTGVYGTALTNGAGGTGVTTNILCINTMNYTFADVENTYDSIPLINAAYKLTYSGDFRIAHILAEQTFNLVTCKGATCGHIVLGTAGQDVVATCRSFDYETAFITLGVAAPGYCADHTASAGYLPKFIIQTSQAFDPLVAVPYTVTAVIKVNGVAGDHGVYWSNTAPTYKASASTTCATAPGAVLFAGQTYADAAGAPVLVGALSGAGVNNCAAVTGKAVSFTTTAGPLFTAGVDKFFELNLPDLVYNLANVNAGDIVSVTVTLTKSTCGDQTFDLCIGTFGCAAGAAGAGAKMLCPYVTSLAAGDSYWNGIALVNTSTKAGPVTLTAVKSDGSANATYTTPSIPAGGMYVKLVSSIPWVGTAPAGVPAYISAQADAGTIPVGGLDAFVMMADGAHNSMGYLCRP